MRIPCREGSDKAFFAVAAAFVTKNIGRNANPAYIYIYLVDAMQIKRKIPA